MKTIKEYLDEYLVMFKDEVVKSVSETYSEDLNLEPVVFALIPKDGKMVVSILAGIGQYLMSDESSDEGLQIIRDFNKELKPVSIAFAAEGLMVMPSAPDGTINIEDGPWEQKVDVIFICFETFNQECNVIFHILKDGDKKYLSEPFIGNWEDKIPDNPKSKFANLLEENYSELAIWVNKQMKEKFNLN